MKEFSLYSDISGTFGIVFNIFHNGTFNKVLKDLLRNLNICQVFNNLSTFFPQSFNSFNFFKLFKKVFNFSTFFQQRTVEKIAPIYRRFRHFSTFQQPLLLLLFYSCVFCFFEFSANMNKLWTDFSRKSPKKIFKKERIF